MSFWKRLFGGPSTATSTEPVRWERRGKSIDEKVAAQAAAWSGPRMEYYAVLDPRDLVEGAQVANFAVAVINGTPILSVKVEVRVDDTNGLRDAVRTGNVTFRSNCHKYPTFPIVYSRLFIPLAAAGTHGPHQIALRGTIAENAGNFTNADLQDWAMAVGKLGHTDIYVYSPSNELLKNGTALLKSESIQALIKAITEAHAVLLKIRADRQDFNKAVQAFFRDHPEPQL